MDWAKDSLERLESTREERLSSIPPKLSAGEAEKLLHKYHPDYSGMQRSIRVGPNANNEKFPTSLQIFSKQIVNFH